RFRQVLINLVDNAIKYTPAGGRVVVRARPAGGGHAGMVEIAVEDTGIGIPARDVPRLTERFFRVDKARSRELGGTGVGLAIAAPHEPLRNEEEAHRPGDGRRVRDHEREQLAEELLVELVDLVVRDADGER